MQNIDIIWLKRDIRLTDHEPFYQASLDSKPVMVIYIYEPLVQNYMDFDYRHWTFINESLDSLTIRVNKTYGHCLEIFKSISKSFKIDTIFSYQETGLGHTFKRDLALKSFFKKNSIKWKEFQSGAVKRGLRYRKNWPKNYLDYINTEIKEIDHSKKSYIEWNDAPPIPEHILKSINKSHTRQKGGEKEAKKSLQIFLDHKINNYFSSISNPHKSRYYCSRLSAHIAYGNISIRQIHQESNLLKVKNGVNKSSLRQFQNRLRWQSHFIQKLEMQTDIENKNLNKAFNQIRSKKDKRLIEAWKTGQTGFPLIDAAMRCVKETGYLNFRLRATVVSFLTHILWQPWQVGAHYLARMFLDYEPGIHYYQFQMQAGTIGINTLRIYNPVKQSLEKDPEGKFILKWVPELRNYPKHLIHTPWSITEMERIMFENNINEQYPLPIVDFKKNYNQAKKKLWQVKNSEFARKESKRILFKHN